jgi:hypothetical protein
MLGIQVAIMLPYDPTGQKGPKIPLPDVVKVHEPKEEDAPVPLPMAPQQIPLQPQSQSQSQSQAQAQEAVAPTTTK